MAEEEINTAGADVSVAAPETSNEPDVSAALDEIYEAHTAPEDEAASPKLQKPAEQQATATGEPQAKDEAQLAEQQAAKQAPHTWTKEEKAAWDAAPEQVKQALYRRAEQVEAYAQSLMETKGFADAMRPIGETLVQLQPYFEGFAGADGKPLWGNPRAIAEEIKALAQVKADFVRNPAQGLSNIIAWGREQGIDMISALREIVHGIEYWPDAESVKLRADAERYRAQAEQYQRQQEEMQQQAAHQQQVQAVGQTVSGFADAKGEDGSPSYPHLHGEYAQEVGELAGRYIRANVQAHGGLTPQLFAEAYNAAVWSHPQARAAEQKRLEDARVAQFKINSQRARKAAGLAPSSSVGSGLRVENMSPQEAMEAVWAQYQER